jgi:DNA invertase Pin-like site-specific DNA recombinase
MSERISDDQLFAELDALRGERDRLDKQIESIMALLHARAVEIRKERASKAARAKAKNGRTGTARPDRPGNGRRTPPKNSGSRPGTAAWRVRREALKRTEPFTKHDLFEVLKSEGVKIQSVQSTLSNLENVGLVKIIEPDGYMKSAVYRVTDQGREEANRRGL